MNSSLSLQDSNIKIPPLLTQEVKLEPDSATSIHLPPSTCYLDNPAVKNQSTLVNMLSYIQSMRAIFEAKEPKTLPWSLVMHNPVNLTSLSKYKSEYEKINLEVKPQPPVAKRKRVVRGPYKKRKKAQEASAQPENISVKKEDQIEESGKCSTSEKDKNSASKDPAKKKPQNRIKNIPGLIVQRVRSSIKTFFAQEPSVGFADRRLAYVSRTLGHLNKSEREKLLTFLEGYEKSWKTWNTIQKYLRGNRRYGNMLHDAVIEFFGEDGRQDFEEWLTAGKMCPKTKQAVIEMKDKIYRKYCHLLDPEDKEGKPEDDDIRGPPGPEKIVKKEEC